MSELSAWIMNTLGKDNWPKIVRDGETITRYPSQRERDIVAHYEREFAKGHLTLVRAYETACRDLQGNNGHATKPQRGKNYRGITANIIRED